MLGSLPGRSRDLQRASRGLLTLALLKEAMAALRRQPVCHRCPARSPSGASITAPGALLDHLAD